MLKAGVPLPPKWLDRPKIESRNRWVFEAFADLSSCRAVGFDVGQIPWSSIVSYCEYNGIYDVDSFKGIINEMDSAYLKFIREKRDAQANKPAKR
jgi:hypothetical protein